MHTRTRAGFTLIELGIVLLLIVLLIAILLPSIYRARHINDGTRCGRNLRQIGQAMMLYANENNGA